MEARAYGSRVPSLYARCKRRAGSNAAPASHDGPAVISDRSHHHPVQSYSYRVLHS